MHDIKVLHLESTDVCQAACPLCAREVDKTFDKTKQHHLTVQQILQVFDTEQIVALDKIFICGNYGDPAAGKHTLEIFKYFRKINPEIVLGMNTNGAIQNTAWWQNIGKLFCKPQDYVVFSIDGLADTNQVYRKNVIWKKLMLNVQSYIAAGGTAHWDMLVYKHNQHQVSQCEQLARDMGFAWFRTKVSKRQLADNLEYPVNWQISKSKIGKVSCHALNEQSVYIDARGRVAPCCRLGSQASILPTMSQVAATWASTNINPVCRDVCGQTGAGNSFTNQWRQEVQLC